jgi:hypothetical protein
MRQLLTDLNTAVDIPALRAPPKAAKLIHSTIQSGTKMRIITERAFGHVVFKARLLGRLHVFHPGTATVRRIAPVTMDGRAGEIVMERTGGEPDQIDAKTLTVLRSFDHKQKPLGQMVYSRWTAHRSNAEIWWGVSLGGVINNMKIVGLVKDNFDEEIDQIVGKRLSDLFVSEDMGDVSLTRSAIEVLSVIEAKREQTGNPD